MFGVADYAAFVVAVIGRRAGARSQAAALLAPGLRHHAAEPEGDSLLRDLLPVVRRSGAAQDVQTF